VRSEGKWCVGVSQAIESGDKRDEHIGTEGSNSSWGLTNSDDLDVKNGDVIGCAYSFSDNPFLNFYLNGEEIEGQSIDKVKGDVYPTVSISDGAEIEFIFAEGTFIHEPPSPKFTALMKCQDMM
jgi:hypothetical protein